MSRLDFRQQKIQEKRKKTPWRQFVKEIASRKNIVLTKNSGVISRYPPVRIKNVVGKNQEILLSQLSIDLESTFFNQFQELFYKQQHPAVISFYENENDSYADSSFGGKNIYLSFEVGDGAENVCYSHLVNTHIDTVLNSVCVSKHSSEVYQSCFVQESSGVFFSKYVIGSSAIYFSENMIGCHECIGCSGLKNQSRCIDNVQWSKEEYLRRKDVYLRELYADSYEVSDSLKIIFVSYSEDVTNAYLCSHITHGNNILFGIGGNESTYCFDGVSIGLDSHYLYACVASGSGSNHLYCCIEVGSSFNCYYSYYLESCSYCLGCVGLKNKSFCILNKQYEKEEWLIIVDEIFERMEKEGLLGTFFPGRVNPYYFNDTLAYLIDDSFTKEEVTAEGYLRRDEEIKVDIPEGVEVVTIEQLDQYEGRMIDGAFMSLNTLQGALPENGEWTIHPDILKKVIQDEKGNYYRIIPMEYKFLKKHGLPLPRLHWLERLKINFKMDK